MRRFLHDNGLGLFFLAIMLLALAGQSVAGHLDHNERLMTDGYEAVPWVDYVTSSSFAVDVAENWQSEYLQFFLFIVVTVWLVQRGSPESKPPHAQGVEPDEKQRLGRHTPENAPSWAGHGGLRGMLYGSSLGLVMGLIFVLSWAAQSVAGWSARNAELIDELRDPIGWGGYVTSPDFWNRTLQNWQSEFLAVLSMVVLSIYLRQRGSPESKPTGAPHGATGVESG